MKTLPLLVGLALTGATALCGAQSAWSPQRNVEIVVGSAPGGSNDKTARQVEKILVEQKLVSTSLTVVNRTGGGGSIAFNYRHAAPRRCSLPDCRHAVAAHQPHHRPEQAEPQRFHAHRLAVQRLRRVRGERRFSDQDRQGPDRAAEEGPPVRRGRLRHGARQPQSHRGRTPDESDRRHPRDLKAVAFKGSSEAITNLLGGHIDLVTTAAGNVAGHVEAGKLRVVGVAAPQRFRGALANIPTWKEQGVNVVFGGWRAIMGPKGLSAAQIAYWEGVLRKATQAPEWQDGIQKNYWSDDFVTSAQFRKDLEKDYADMKAVLVDLGLAKQ